MRVLIKDDFVDFEAPIQMTYGQQEKFIEFMKKMFPGKVKTQDVIEKGREVGARATKPKSWVPKELSLLLSAKANDEIADKLSRSEMSVRMYRGHFVPEFMEWAKNKGHTLSQSRSEKIIRQFLDEKGGR